MSVVVEINPTPLTDPTNYIDVTNDVSLRSLSSFKRQIDNNEFDVGIFRRSNIKPVLDNRTGKYSTRQDPNSIFTDERQNSLVRLSWRGGGTAAQAGVATAGSITNASMLPTVEVFEGLLREDDVSFSPTDFFIRFSVLGKEVLLEEAKASSAGVVVGDTASAALLKLLDQAPINSYLTVSALNINPSVDFTLEGLPDNLSSQTAKQAVETLLVLSNSTLQVVNDTILIKARDAAASISTEFYNQRSTLGPENVIDVREVRDGKNRVFNYIRIDNVLSLEDDTSQDRYGLKVKSLSTDGFITADETKADSAESYLGEFAYPREEIKLVAPLNYETVDLQPLDRVTLDWEPEILEEENPIPIAGVAVAGTDIYPDAVFGFSSTSSQPWKILDINFSFSQDRATFTLRRI